MHILLIIALSLSVGAIIGFVLCSCLVVSRDSDTNLNWREEDE